MRKFLIGAATIAALAAVPTAASAQASTVTGVAVGAGTGAAVGGPPGAIIGGIIGGSFGAAAEPRVHVQERVYVEPRAYHPVPRGRVHVRTYEYQAEPVCWIDDWGRQLCEYD